MASGKDTRIVQMQFDNKNFEKNIATSQKSLERFKKELNFDETSKGLKDFLNRTKDMAFDTLSNNIQKLTDKFTGLGNAGEFALSRIRNMLENAALSAERFVKSLALDQIGVGEGKYDALTRSVQTIVAGGLATEKEAYGIMERVMEYTNQTSHSFETMVGQISSLASIGIPVGKAEKYMEGFANSATKAGANAEKAAIAMGVYTKAMSSYMTKNEFDTLNLTARVVTKEWREEMIAAGLAAGDLVKGTDGVIRTNKKYGKQVEVTANNIENTLNKKWLSKDTMAIFAERYGFGESIEDLRHPEQAAESFGKTAYLTGQRALTLADALGAVKESISGGWMTTFRILFGDLTDAMNLWTGSCNKVIDALAGIADARNAVLEAWRNLGGRDSLLKLIFGEMEDTEGNVMYEGAYGIIDMITDIGNMITEAFYDTFKNLIPQSQQDAILKAVNDNFEQLGLDKPFENFNELWESEFFKETGGRTAFLGGALTGITEDIQKFVQSINEWFNEIDPDSGLTRLQKIENVLTAIGRTIAFVIELGAGIAHFFDILTDDEHLGPSLTTISNLLNTLGLTIIDTENEASNAGKINTFFESLAETLKPICDLVNMVVGSLADLVLAMVQGEQENGTFADAMVKIGDTIKKVIDFITKLATPIAEFISEVSGILADLFRDGFSPEAIDKAKSKFSQALTKLWNGLKEVFQPLLDKLGAFFKLLWEEIQNRITAYFNNPETVGYKIWQPIKAAFEFLSPIWDMLKDLWNRIKGIFTTGEGGKLQGPTLFDTLKLIFLNDGVKNLFKSLKNLAKDGGLYQLLMAALGGVAIWRIIKAVNTIGGFFDDVGGNLKAGVLGTYEWFSEKIQGIAKGMMMLAASVYLLGNMKTESVIQGVLALGIIMGEFVGFVHLMDKVNGATLTKQATLTASITALAGSMAILILSILPFAFVDWEGFVRMIVGLGAVLLELIGAMELMKKLSLYPDIHLGGFLAFAFSIQLVMFSLIPLMIADWGGMLRAVVGLGLVLLELIGFMKLMSLLSLKSDALALGGIFRFTASIALLMFSLTPFMIADWSSMLRAVAGLGIVLLELIAFMELMKLMSLSSYTLNMKGMYKFAISVGILMFSLTPLLIAGWDAMFRAVAGLGIVLLELLGFMELMKVLSLSSYSLNMKGMYKLAASIGLLMLSLIPFMVTDWNGLLRAVVGLAAVLAELAGFMYLIKLIGAYPDISLGGFTKFALSVGILMLSLIPFMVTDWGGMLRAITGLGLVLGELIGFMALTQNVIGLRMDRLAGFIGFAIGLSVLTLAISKFADMSWENWAKSMAGLGVILLEIAGFMALINAIPVKPSAIGMVISICLSIGVMAILLSVAMNEVRNIKWEVIVAFMAGLSVAMIAMAGAIAILSNVPLAAGIKGILLLSIAMGAIMGIVTMLGPMLISSIGDSLTQLSGKLELISGLIKSFAERMGQVDRNNISAAEDIFDKLKGLLGKLAGWGKFTGDLDNFSYAMFALGTGMDIFNSHVGGAVTELDTNAQAALKFIQDLSACAGDLDTIANMNINGLVNAVAGLGGAMSIYAYGAREVQGMISPDGVPDQSVVEASVAILQAISSALTEAGGFTIPDNMPDEQALGLFGAQLSALATALVRFEEAGSGLGAGTMQALGVLDFFRDLKERLVSTEFEKNLKASVGIFDKNEVGREELTQFGTNIEQLGLALKKFYESVTILDEATGERVTINLDGPLKTLESLQEIQSKLGWDFGPFIQFFAGRTKDFGDLGGEIEALGTAMQDFVNKLGGVDETGAPKFDETLFDTALEIVDKIVDKLKEVGTRMGRVNGIWFGLIVPLFAGREFNFEDLKTQLIALADGLGSLGQLKAEGKLLSIDDVDPIFEVIDSITTYLQKLGNKMGRVWGLWNMLVTFFAGKNYDFTDLEVQLTALGKGLQGLSAFEVEDLPTTDDMEGIFPTIDAILDYLNSLKEKMAKVPGVAGTLNRTFGEGFDFDFKDLQGQLEALGKGLAAISGLTISSDSTSVFSEEGRATALGTVDKLISYMQELGGKLGRVGGIGAWFQNLFEGKRADFEYIGTQLGHLGDGLGKFQAGITANGDFDATKIAEALGALDHLVSMMQTFSVLEEKMDAISQSYGNTSYTMVDFFNNMWDALYVMANGTKEKGPVVKLLADFVKGFDSELAELGGLENTGSVDILKSLTDAIANLVIAARTMQNDQGAIVVDFSVIGTNICQGIINGILAGQSGVIDTAVNMALSVYEAVKAALKIESPSRVFMELGGYVGIGFANGIAGQQANVDAAAMGLADSAVNSATEAMALFAQLMSQEIDANPTITPVMDLSNIYAGSAEINGLLGAQQQLSLAGAGAGYSSSSVPRGDRGSGEYRGQDLTGVYAAINSLGGRIDAMSDAVSHMQIVMNTGALVGEVTDGINRNLGAKTTYGRRRN